MPNNPVQIVLNTRDFFVVPEPGRWGPAKDFFEDRDREFAEHRDTLLDQVEGIKSSFEKSGIASGVLKVKMRREAWAKSHRPNRVLFPPNKRPCIGVSGVGELFYLVAAVDLPEIETEISNAENATRWRKSKKSDVVYAAPSHQRSDVGAVESIALPTPADKRAFSVDQAVAWLSDPRTSGAYLVEVFSPPRMTNPGAVQYFDRVLREIRVSVGDNKLVAETFVLDAGVAASDTPANVFGIKLVDSESDGVFNRSAGDHEKLLSLLDSHAYIRRILLPPIVVAARLNKTVGSSVETPPTPSSNYTYPKVGIIDGGIGPLLGPWILGSHGILAPEDQDRDHGTFIGGLLVAAKQLNGERVCGEEDGCGLFDISVFPDVGKPETFANYYPKGLRDFIGEISEGTRNTRFQHEFESAGSRPGR
jgi:hypothetical protein